MNNGLGECCILITVRVPNPKAVRVTNLFFVNSP